MENSLPEKLVTLIDSLREENPTWVFREYDYRDRLVFDDEKNVQTVKVKIIKADDDYWINNTWSFPGLGR